MKWHEAIAIVIQVVLIGGTGLLIFIAPEAGVWEGVFGLVMLMLALDWRYQWRRDR